MDSDHFFPILGKIRNQDEKTVYVVIQIDNFSRNSFKPDIEILAVFTDKENARLFAIKNRVFGNNIVIYESVIDPSVYSPKRDTSYIS